MAKDPQRYQELVAQALEDRRAWLLAQPLPAPPAITKATVLSFLARQDAAAAAAAASAAAHASCSCSCSCCATGCPGGGGSPSAPWRH